MTSKILTVVPLLILSGLFFAAGIVEGGHPLPRLCGR